MLATGSWLDPGAQAAIASQHSDRVDVHVHLPPDWSVPFQRDSGYRTEVVYPVPHCWIGSVFLGSEVSSTPFAGSPGHLSLQNVLSRMGTTH